MHSPLFTQGYQAILSHSCVTPAQEAFLNPTAKHGLDNDKENTRHDRCNTEKIQSHGVYF